MAEPSFRALDFLKAVALGWALMVGQGLADAWLGWTGWAPEWALLLTLYAACRLEKWAAFGAAFVFGLSREALGGGPAGVYPLTAMAAVWLFYPYRPRFNLASWPTLMFCAFSLVLAGDALAATPLMAVLGWPGEGFNPLFSFIKSAATSALAAPVLFRALDRLTGRRAAARAGYG